MYRARVEAVSGLKVRAGGKWLTCIGNRTVKAGDMIWTDGRCVYGHDREAQTPLVIVNPAKKDLTIPLCLPNGWVRTSSISFSKYSVQKNKIDYMRILQGTDLPEFIDPFWGLEEDANYLMTNAADKIIFSNAPAMGATRKMPGFEDVIGRIALNVDNDGNIYEIRFESWRTAYAGTGKYRVQIVKNNSVVYSFNADSDEYDEDFIRPTNFNYWLSKRGMSCSSSFIENENHWWVIFSSTTDFYANTNSRDEFWQVTFTMVDNYGKHRLFACTSNDLTVDQNIKIPMQDGFYFKINGDIKVDYHTNDESVKTEIPVTIYSPRDVPLMDTKVSRSLFYFAGYQINRHKFLISSRQEGIFLCSNGNINQIFNGLIANQCLRPMKKYKHWWEQIEIIDEGGEESE